MSKKIKIRIKNPIMCVPITFLDKMNKEEFEIVESKVVHPKINGKSVYVRMPIRKKVKTK